MQLAKVNGLLAILANIGVLAGIIFVGIEIQQNTSAVQSSTLQDITNSTAEALFLRLANPEIGEVIIRGRDDLSSLSEIDRSQFNTYQRVMWLRFQNTHYQYELGSFPERIWESYYQIMCGQLTIPGIREDWPRHTRVLSSEFVTLIESCTPR